MLEYIRFTQRVPLTQEFVPSDDELRLYELVSAYLQRENLVVLPASQRTLMTLVRRKLLALSTFAIAGTLRKLVGRLEQAERLRRLGDRNAPELSRTEEDFDAVDELADEWPDGEDDA